MTFISLGASELPSVTELSLVLAHEALFDGQFPPINEQNSLFTAVTFVRKGEAPFLPAPFVTPPTPLTIISATFVSGKLRLTFNQPLLSAPALSDPCNYLVTGPTAVMVLAATPQAIPNPTYVDLTLTEQHIGGSYNVEVTRIQGTLE
jgi:hypothetical protein